MGNSSAREQAIQPEDLARLFILRANAGDADGVAALYEPDAILASPGGGTVVGRAAIRDFYARFLSSGRSFQGDPPSTLRCGNVALLSTRGAMGRVTAEVARQQSDGSWLWVIVQPSIAE
jgi:ketosteroid isomerase-like protein